MHLQHQQTLNLNPNPIKEYVKTNTFNTQLLIRPFQVIFIVYHDNYQS